MPVPAVSRAKLRFAQLSCLGLSPEAVVPALLELLHSIVPSLANTFYFTNERGETTNIYIENTEYYPLLPLYWEIIHERAERCIKGNAFTDAVDLFGSHTREQSVSASRGEIMRTDFYNLTERVVGYDPNFLRLIVREGNRMRGGVRLWRSLGRGSWTNDEKAALDSLATCFAHALRHREIESGALVDGGDRGIIVAETSGRVLYTTKEGRRLLFLACHSRNGPGVAFRRLDTLPPNLAILCSRLARVSGGDATIGLPSHLVRNQWGEFSFHCQWLEGSTRAAGLIAIEVNHREPRSLVLMRRAHALDLTSRQAEVCVLLAEGLSTGEIAERLAISQNTANEHGRLVYSRLGVHNRAELTAKLLTPK